jgi:hypothetical protein
MVGTPNAPYSTRILLQQLVMHTHYKLEKCIMLLPTLINHQSGFGVDFKNEKKDISFNLDLN